MQAFDCSNSVTSPFAVVPFLNISEQFRYDYTPERNVAWQYRSLLTFDDECGNIFKIVRIHCNRSPAAVDDHNVNNKFTACGIRSLMTIDDCPIDVGFLIWNNRSPTAIDDVNLFFWENALNCFWIAISQHHFFVHKKLTVNQQHVWSCKPRHSFTWFFFLLTVLYSIGL